MMKHGPVDVMVIGFGEPRFDGSALAALEKQAAAGTIRVLDLVILLKDQDGRGWRIALSDLPPEEAAAVAFIEAETHGLFDDDDANLLFEGMVPGSALAAVAIEHTWAIDFANAVAAEGGELGPNFRVPAPIVDEAFALLA